MIQLLILLNLCHWAADYTHLSTPWMLKAKAKGWPLYPILCHACCHGTLMCLVLYFFTDIATATYLMFVQIASHFIIDVFKGYAQHTLRLQAANPFFWWLFGADQFLHQAVIIFMANEATK
jgi:hypothetical protein